MIGAQIEAAEEEDYERASQLDEQMVNIRANIEKTKQELVEMPSKLGELESKKTEASCNCI